MPKSSKARILFRIAFFSAIFLACAYFYTKVVPLVVYNTDDWAFLTPRRYPWPVWGAWNPSRVLPETLMPLTARIAKRLFFPVLGEFIPSVELGLSLAVSLFVTLYAAFFYRLAVKKSPEGESAALTLLFLLLHFLVLRTKAQNNDFLLAGYKDATTFFFYVIPALWNGSLILYLVAEDYFRTRRAKPWPVRALVAVSVYFAVFSNIFQSVMLAAYAGFMLLCQLFDKRRPAKERLRDARFPLLILLLWIVSLVYEFFGRRSRQIQDRDPAALLRLLRLSGGQLVKRLRNINGFFLLFLLLSFLLFSFILWKRKGEERTRCASRGAVLLLCAASVLIFEWLLCSASSEIYTYVRRGDVLISAFFFLFLFMLDQVRGFCSEKKPFRILLPALLLVCCFGTFTPGKTWRNPTYGGVDPAIARRVTADIVNALIEADQAGETSVTLSVPAYDGDDNWPLFKPDSRFFSDAMYFYDQTGEWIRVIFAPDRERNAYYGLPLPK